MLETVSLSLFFNTFIYSFIFGITVTLAANLFFPIFVRRLSLESSFSKFKYNSVGIYDYSLKSWMTFPMWEALGGSFRGCATAHEGTAPGEAVGIFVSCTLFLIHLLAHVALSVCAKRCRRQ